MSAWGVRWNPWSSNYSSLECDQMRFVQKAYCESFEVNDEDLPPQLRMNESFAAPLYQPSLADFDEHTFMRKMQDVVGLLRNPAESIISTICAYQTSRTQRIGLHTFHNDPRTLLLEEFKEWAMKTLAPASCTTESTLNNVRMRYAYILRLQHGQQGMFQPGSGERSLLSTLKEVRQIIETAVLATIETERAHSSARDQLQTLEARGTDGLIHGVQFLFYVLRNTSNVPGDCTISTLRNQLRIGMKEALQSKSGRMLQLLINTPSFSTLFPSQSVVSIPGDNVRATDLVEAQVGRPLFASNDMKGVVPSCLVSGATSDINPTEYLSRNAGLVALSADVANETYEKFTRLHAMLKLLADLIVSCRKARQLAGPGGDLLVYGPGGEEVRRLVQSCESVQGEIVRLVGSITRTGVKQLDRLKPNQEKSWRSSFSKVLPLENYISHDFQACIEPIQRIYANADPVNVRKLYGEFRQATGLWVEENSTICDNVSMTLGLPVVERRKLSALEAAKSPLSIVQEEVEIDEEQYESGSGIIGLPVQAATNLVSWGVDMLRFSSTKAPSPERKEMPRGSPDSDDSSSRIGSCNSVNSNTGIMDVILLVRQAVQRMSQLAWGVKSCLRTAQFDEREADAYVVMCAVYDAAGVETCETLFLELRHHESSLNHLFRGHVGSILRCISVLQFRIIDPGQDISKLLEVFQRLKAILNTFTLKFDDLKQTHSRIIDECNRMKEGILEMPDLVPRGEGAGMFALQSLSLLASSSLRTEPSSAISSHAEYMTQTSLQLLLHQNSLRHLQLSLESAHEAVQQTLERLEEIPPGETVNAQVLDYIFEFNYESFFRTSTQDLNMLLNHMSTMGY